MSAMIAVLLPVLAGLALLAPGPLRRVALAAGPWLPLALLWPAFGGPGCECEPVLLGLRMEADAVTRPLIVLCALAWTAAGWFARSRLQQRNVSFWLGWQASFTGMALLLLARELGGLYVGYAIVSLASWLIIVHARSDAAWRAGRIYLIMALIGEMAVFAGVVAIVSEAGNAGLATLVAPAAIDAPWRWLLFLGYAVKMGMLGLHLWLPLAHPVAPVPASAVLSGVIVKAGLVGWLRLVPPGSGMELAAETLLLLGIVTAFAGVALGLAQDRIKVVLAYSTISQMGLVTAGFAALLMTADPVAAYPWLGVLVLHHGLNKASLFLACGCAPGRSAWRGVLIALPSLALAGAPLTTGVLGKTGLKTLFHDAGLGDGWILALSLSSTATALLLWRFWRLARAETGDARAHPAWVALTLGAVAVPWFWAVAAQVDAIYAVTHPWSATWPLLIAAALIAAAARAPALARLRIPPGDLVVPLERVAHNGRRVWSRWMRGQPEPPFRASGRPGHAFVRASERYLRAIPVAGFLILVVGAAMWLLSRLAQGL